MLHIGTVNNPLGEYTPLSLELFNNSLGNSIANVWVWEPRVPIIEAYTLTYYFDDTVLEMLEKQPGEVITELMPEPTKANYTFIGWYTEKSDGDRWNFEQQSMPDRDLDLFARFEANEEVITTPEVQENHNVESQEANKETNILNTGDETKILRYIILIGIAIFGFLVYWKMR